MKKIALSVGFFGLLVSLASTLGCGGGAGNVGDKLRPKDSTAKDALNEPGSLIKACKPAAGEPLVVDLRSSDRSDFELAMQDGVAVVSYNCKELHLLKGCSVHGAAYVFSGVSRKEDVVQMESKDEVQANIPITGAKLSAELKAGSTLELALITVGKKRAQNRNVHTEDLEGDCETATHVVRGAYIGAFAMGTGTAGQASAVTEMFGVGAGGSSVNKRKATAKDGDLIACRTAEQSASSPPAECQAIIRLDLAPLRPRGGPNPNKTPPPPSTPPTSEPVPEPMADASGDSAMPAPSQSSSSSSSSGVKGSKPKPGSKPPKKPTKGSSASAAPPPPPGGGPSPSSLSLKGASAAASSKSVAEDEAEEVKSCAEGFAWNGVICKKK